MRRKANLNFRDSSFVDWVGALDLVGSWRIQLSVVASVMRDLKFILHYSPS